MDSLFASAGNTSSCIVIDRQGSHIGKAGTSEGLGNELDKAVLIALRRRADAIVTSARTANLEGYRMPRRAHLVIYGDITQVASTRLTHGLGRLLLVGNAQEFGSIPGSKVVASLPLQSNVIREHLGFEKRAESGTVHFEFGLVGLESIKGEIETFLCTAPNLETSRLFVGRHLGDFKLSTELQLGPLSLSWWERRGMGLSQG